MCSILQSSFRQEMNEVNASFSVCKETKARTTVNTFEALTYHYSVGEDDEKLPYSDSDTRRLCILVNVLIISVDFPQIVECQNRQS